MKGASYYEVHALAVTELLKKVPRIGGVILETSVGTGAISKPLKEYLPHSEIITNDEAEMLPANYHYNLTRLHNWKEFQPVDWVISSPLFDQAFKILVHAYDHTTRGIALLLRLSFLEPTYERQNWLEQHPPTRLIVLPRYSFSQDGKTDSVTTAWFVWEKDRPWESHHAIQIVTK